jgi:hypothetical protein
MIKYLTYLNSGCKDICDNMLLSASNVGISKGEFKIIAFDKPIYDYYSNKGIDIDLYLDSPEEKYHEWSWDINSKFRHLVKNKWSIIKNQYTKYKNLVWLDTDVVFFKNPLDELKNCLVPTFQVDYPVACACTGFMYFPNNNLSEKIVNDLGSQNTEDDQLICNSYLRSNSIQNQIKFFDLNLFPNGSYFYDHKGSDKNTAIILHCNYILGLENKINRLKDIGAWYL